MFQPHEIHGAARSLANVEGWAKNWGVWAKNWGVWAQIEKVGQECIFLGKGVISLGKEILFILHQEEGCVRLALAAANHLSLDAMEQANAILEFPGSPEHE